MKRFSCLLTLCLAACTNTVYPPMDNEENDAGQDAPSTHDAGAAAPNAHETGCVMVCPKAGATECIGNALLLCQNVCEGYGFDHYCDAGCANGSCL